MPDGSEQAVSAGHGAITRMPFDERAVGAVARALGAECRLAPFRLPGGAVHQVTIAGEDGRPAAMLTLWPAIARVDVVAPGVTVVATRVHGVEIVGGVEVLFRRDSGEYLIVTLRGKVIVRS